MAKPGKAWQRKTAKESAAAAEGTIDWHAGWESGGSDWDGPLADVRRTPMLNAAHMYSAWRHCDVVHLIGSTFVPTRCVAQIRCHLGPLKMAGTRRQGLHQRSG